MMRTDEIRQKFLNYFISLKHELIESSSLIPDNDPTLLFTNAGMNQFKDIFLGKESRSYTKATSVQKCVRAGGKHNDLENVGYTARHHTFFEMLGNFSFGSYFKHNAIIYAWEFLIKELQLPEHKLYVTVYYKDTEAYNIWHDTIGLSSDKIIKINDNPDGSSDNFWQMGDTGPCGPSTEIFYDHGDTVAGGLPGTANADGDRYVEIWNCVFMQFNRDHNNILHSLPTPAVDTGMGLERITAVMQVVSNNYDIDIFQALIKKSHAIINNYDGCINNDNCDIKHNSLKILADHIRAIGFLIADGVIASNEGRGYVLRRIIRRAVRHGYLLGKRTAFLYQLIDELIVQMHYYKELAIKRDLIIGILKQEETNFFNTIGYGIDLLMTQINLLVDNKSININNNLILDGNIAFKLYDTFGFPLDLTKQICQEQNIIVDEVVFNHAMEQQKLLSTKQHKFKPIDQGNSYNIEQYIKSNDDYTIFMGYDTKHISTQAKVIALYKLDNINQTVTIVNQLAINDYGIIVLNQTPFYAQSGGQIGDAGTIKINDGINTLFNVNDVQYLFKDNDHNVIGHYGNIINGEIKLDDKVVASYDIKKRNAIKRNHSATHLLHQALHEILGDNATQQGSLVNDTYTRFDFIAAKALTKTQLLHIEIMVNNAIMNNHKVITKVLSYNEVINKSHTKTMALFGEKYGDLVRVVNMGDFSHELCGGTHVTMTGEIGLFKIIEEKSIASGIRRITAITGEAALTYIQNQEILIDDVKLLLKAPSANNILDKINVLYQQHKIQQKNIDKLQTQINDSLIDTLITKVQLINNNIKLLITTITNQDGKSLTNIMTKLQNKLNGIIILINTQDNTKIIKNNDTSNLQQQNSDHAKNNNIDIIIAVDKSLIHQYQANKLLQIMTDILGGNGGGRPDLARGNGIHHHHITETIKVIIQFFK